MALLWCGQLPGLLLYCCPPLAGGLAPVASIAEVPFLPLCHKHNVHEYSSCSRRDRCLEGRPSSVVFCLCLSRTDIPAVRRPTARTRATMHTASTVEWCYWLFTLQKKNTTFVLKISWQSFVIEPNSPLVHKENANMDNLSGMKSVYEADGHAGCMYKRSSYACLHGCITRSWGCFSWLSTGWFSGMCIKS